MNAGRSILIFFGAFLFSVVLWAYVRLSNPYEADVDLPVRLTPPKAFALSSGLPEHLHTRIRGAGWQILLMNFTKNSRYQFDLAERAVSDTIPLVLTSDEILHNVMVPSDVRVLKVEPDSLRLTFSKRISKRVPVVPRLLITTARGYATVGSATVSPATIVIEGSKSVLDSIRFFPTQPVSESNAADDIDKTVLISDTLENFVTVPAATKLTVHVDVEPIGEQIIRHIPLSIQALPPEFDVLLIPNTIDVTLRGGASELSKLSVSDLKAHIAYDPILFDTAKTVTPHVDVPTGLTLLSQEPRQVKFILRRKAARLIDANN